MKTFNCTDRHWEECELRACVKVIRLRLRCLIGTDNRDQVEAMAAAISLCVKRIEEVANDLATSS
jgi:hypothetical protein